MNEIRDEFLSEGDLDLRNLTWEELIAHWHLWLHQAQATNDLDEALYSYGVFERDPAVHEKTRDEKDSAAQPSAENEPLHKRSTGSMASRFLP